jgi:uncharacterized protein YcbK (DUF882 family)
VPVSFVRGSLLVLNCSRVGRRFGLAVLLTVAGTQGLQTAVANGDTRTLTIHHTHTGEDISVTYKRNGRYDEAALGRVNHFLRDWRNHAQTNMDPRLLDVVWEVYQEVGGKEPIQIISAYRSPQTNSMLRSRSRGVAQFSQHMLGKAIDFNIPGVPLEQIRIAGLRLQRGGVGFYPSSGSAFVHLDVGSVRHWPRMTHDQLARIFPNGRTVHVGTDGQPLPGYALALADIERRGGAPSGTSLSAARHAGVAVASNDDRFSGSSKRNLLSRLFGYDGRKDAEEEEGAPATTASIRTTVATRVTADEEPVRKPVQMAAAVPLPRARPAVEAPVRVASAVPIRASGAPTPAQVIESRGIWGGPEAFASLESVRAAAAGKGQRLAQGMPASEALKTIAARRAPVPRPRPEAAPEKVDVAANLPPWPGQSAEDRELPTAALAYAPAAIDGNYRTPSGAGGSVISKTSQGRASERASASRLGENPWLRGVIATPSVKNALAVSVVGAPNHPEFARLMHKPKAAVPNAFANDPVFGMSTMSFSGEAIGSMPTISFPRVTAGLR